MQGRSAAAAAAGQGLGSRLTLPPKSLQDGRGHLLQVPSRELKEQAGALVAMDFSKSNEEKVKKGLGKLKCRLG